MSKKNKITIKELPNIERPREKLIKYGPDKLSDQELLAILLRSGTKDENVLDLAGNILKKFSKDKLQRENDMFAEALGGISLAQKPERYVDFSKATTQLKQRAKSLDMLKQYNDAQQVDRILSKYPQATGFVPLKANAVDMTVLINKDKGEVVKIVDLRPWK